MTRSAAVPTDECELVRLELADLELASPEPAGPEPARGEPPESTGPDPAAPEHESFWAAHLELSERAPTDDQLDQLTTSLASYRAAVGVSGYGYLAVQLEVRASGWAQAGLRARTAVELAAVEAGIVGRDLVQIEVLASVDELERRSQMPPPAYMPQVMGTSTAARVLGLTSTAVLKHAQAGHFGAQRADNAWVFVAAQVYRERARRDALPARSPRRRGAD